jgi:hypothetical protein
MQDNTLMCIMSVASLASESLTLENRGQFIRCFSWSEPVLAYHRLNIHK